MWVPFRIYPHAWKATVLSVLGLILTVACLFLFAFIFISEIDAAFRGRVTPPPFAPGVIVTLVVLAVLLVLGRLCNLLAARLAPWEQTKYAQRQLEKRNGKK